MTRVAQRLLDEARSLPTEDRAEIAQELLSTLEQPDSRSEAEWLAEIERRARAAIDGAPGLTWEEAKARIRQRLAERYGPGEAAGV